MAVDVPLEDVAVAVGCFGVGVGRCVVEWVAVAVFVEVMALYLL